MKLGDRDKERLRSVRDLVVTAHDLIGDILQSTKDQPNGGGAFMTPREVLETTMGQLSDIEGNIIALADELDVEVA